MTEWVWLIDEYRAGTVFITDDPTGKQGAIAEGLRETVADRIVKAHNASLLAAQGAAAPPDQRMQDALGALEEWARIVIPMLRNAGDDEAADFGEDRIAQSQDATPKPATERLQEAGSPESVTQT